MIGAGSMSKRIVHVVLSLETGGMETFIADLVRKQHNHHDVVVVCTDTIGPIGELLKAEGVAVEILKRHGELPFVPRLADRIGSIDVLNSHSGLYHPAARASKLGRVPVHVTTDHGRFNPDPLKVRIGDLLHLRGVDRIVAVSHELHDYLRYRVHIPARKLCTIINGVDTDRFAPVKDSSGRDRLRAEWNIAPGTIVVGSVGRLAEVKEYDTLIRAVAQAASDGTPIALVLAGDGPERAELESLGKELNAPLRMLGECRNVPDILRAFDLFALTSRSEGTSMAILEAEATGLPIFATPVGGNPHLVEDNVHGRLLPVSDIDAWAQALTVAAREWPKLAAWGQAAREHVVKNFSLDHAVAAYDRLYDELLTAKGARA